MAKSAVSPRDQEIDKLIQTVKYSGYRPIKDLTVGERWEELVCLIHGNGLHKGRGFATIHIAGRITRLAHALSFTTKSSMEDVVRKGRSMARLVDSFVG